MAAKTPPESTQAELEVDAPLTKPRAVVLPSKHRTYRTKTLHFPAPVALLRKLEKQHFYIKTSRYFRINSYEVLKQEFSRQETSCCLRGWIKGRFTVVRMENNTIINK